MSRIELKNIDKYYGSNHVLKNLNLTIEDGAFMTLLGPSGCGKTTTLRVLSGLENPQNGVILMNDEKIVDAATDFFTPPDKRKLNLVFQSYALWPHMTVFENVAFGLRIKKLAKEEIKRKVDQALERLQILEYSARYPSELSGGQQQRVAIARAIVSDPELLLMDEPLSNLDAKLRMDMRSEIKRLHMEMGTTVVYVTHDQSEALTMSTHIAVFFNGELKQVDTPINVYTNPANLEVAAFIGTPRTNFVEGRARYEDESLKVDTVIGEYSYKEETFTGEEKKTGEFKVVVGIRPEQITISRIKGEIPPNSIVGEVYSVMPSGSETLVEVNVGDTRILIKLMGLIRLSPGEMVSLGFSPESFTVYDKESGRLIKKVDVSDSDIK
ncbi:MAG: ABC transporter ATP-binding protein [Spirochaetales bacterium]|nr:ABC transporter ATP-binding protein [Spirochaetales bacterium]